MVPFLVPPASISAPLDRKLEGRPLVEHGPPSRAFQGGAPTPLQDQIQEKEAPPAVGLLLFLRLLVLCVV